MIKARQTLTLILSLLVSAFAAADPILVFKPTDARLLLGVDDVVLNGERYDVRFGTGNATIFSTQESAIAASNALINQVFATEPFTSLNIGSHTPADWGVWLGQSPIGRGQFLTVAQFWGERLDYCEPGKTSTQYGCNPTMNQSIVVLSPTHDQSSIINTSGFAGFLSDCGDCGALETLWIKRNVLEPSTLALLLISLTLIAIHRRLSYRKATIQ